MNRQWSGRPLSTQGQAATYNYPQRSDALGPYRTNDDGWVIQLNTNERVLIPANTLLLSVLYPYGAYTGLINVELDNGTTYSSYMPLSLPRPGYITATPGSYKLSVEAMRWFPPVVSTQPQPDHLPQIWLPPESFPNWSEPGDTPPDDLHRYYFLVWRFSTRGYSPPSVAVVENVNLIESVELGLSSTYGFEEVVNTEGVHEHPSVNSTDVNILEIYEQDDPTLQPIVTLEVLTGTRSVYAGGNIQVVASRYATGLISEEDDPDGVGGEFETHYSKSGTYFTGDSFTLTPAEEEIPIAPLPVRDPDLPPLSEDDEHKILEVILRPVPPNASLDFWGTGSNSIINDQVSLAGGLVYYRGEVGLVLNGFTTTQTSWFTRAFRPVLTEEHEQGLVQVWIAVIAVRLKLAPHPLYG